MSLEIHALPDAAPGAEPAGFDDSALAPNWAERVITVVATALAVFIVAAVAVLMGMI
jgi:hypothetical protein